MESWLVTIDNTVCDSEALRRFTVAGAVPDTEADVVQFDNDERAITVFATATVATALSGFTWVKGVFPNSDMQAY